MEQLKRSRNNIGDEYDSSKRKKTSLTTEESITTFEHLSNELIYEIFEYLDFHHAFQGFYDLNERFQNLFVHSNLPIKINILSISKFIFQRYLSHIILPHTDRIKSLRLSNPFAADMSLLLVPTMTNFTRLETLIIINIESKYIEGVVNNLSSLPVLSSVVITSIDSIMNQATIYQKIFRLPALKYCQMSIEAKRYFYPVSIATKEFSPIEHLVINNKVAVNQLDSFLSYVPKLRRLSLGNLDGNRSYRAYKSAIALNYLTDVSLKLYSVSFNDFEALVIDYFRQVSRMVLYSKCFFFSNAQYIDADRWDRLISTHMPNLCVFDFQHRCRLWDDDNDRQAYEAQLHKFNSLFWRNHQWFFDHKYYKKKYFNSAIFYSTNPYRRKYYMLYKELDNNIYSTPFQTNVNPVHHVHIHSTNAMKQFMGNFPNTNELTFSETFDVPRDSITVNLNLIIPLRQLTKLTLDCHSFPFERLVELLSFTPNIHTLKLDAILLYGADSVSIQQNDIFQLVSNTNAVTNLTINKEITLEKIQLLVALFPRLEYLTMNLYKEDLEPIARFLLSKSNNNTRYLSSLCVSKQRSDFVGNLRLLLESKKLLNDYTLKVINRKLYLWW